MSDPTERIRGIDFLKGLLIALVVAAHLIRDRECFLYRAICAFLMPLFLAVSGYLISEASLRRLTVAGMLRKYMLRLGFPYLVASAAFFVYEHHEAMLDGTLSALTVLDAVRYPFHQLWFVPVWLASIVVLYAALRLRVPVPVLTVAALGMSLAWLALFGQDRVGPEYLRPFGDKRVFYLSGYLFLGFCLRNRWGPLSERWTIRLLAIPLFAAYMATFYVPCPQALPALSFTLLNVVVAYAGLSFFARARSLRIEPLNWMGQESLAIYLWHPAIIILGRILFLPRYGGTVFYLATTLLLAGVLLPAIRLLSRVPFVGRYVFGTAAGRRRAPPEAGSGRAA